MRSSILAVSAVLVAFSFHPAAAQALSSDDIVAGLRPTARQLAGPTRGIRRLPVMATQKVQVGPAVRAEGPADDAAAPAVKLVVDFRTGSAELTPAASRTLDQLGRALASDALSTYRFRIEGHTDTVGDADTNKDLSQRRAQTVAAYVQDKFGIAATRLEVVGLGSSELLVATPDQTPEPRNRRVRIVNIGT